MGNDSLLKKDLLNKILYEANAYKSYKEIEKLIENNQDLSVVPIEPLYLSLKNTPSDELATILPKMSEEQRQAVIDLDFWQKDVVDLKGMSRWLEAYSKCKDDSVVTEFAKGEDFLLYIKSRLIIHTFDVEDPEYPEHDYYFLTDDMLLLIEYDESFEYANEVKYLIRNIYAELGVEKAYAHIFKLVTDSYSELLEKDYQEKKERLREFGFVDYYDALEYLSPFRNLTQLNQFLSKKERLTPELDLTSKNQSLHSSMLIHFENKELGLFEEASKVTDEKREDFLKFNFIRLVNSVSVVQGGLKKGSTEFARISKEMVSILELALSYLQHEKGEGHLKVNSDIFNSFDFIDLYRIGSSLISQGKENLKKAIQNTPFDHEEFEYFLGSYLNSFLEDSFFYIPKVRNFEARQNVKEMNSYETYKFWIKNINFLKDVIPFAATFYETLSQLKSEGKLNDNFYLNYQVDNIDFEAIIISSFINHLLGNFSDRDVNKMGLTIGEFRSFLKEYTEVKNNEFYLLGIDHEKIKKGIDTFLSSFGFSKITGFSEFLYGIMSEEINGYNFDELSDEDFKHIGGPILLNFTLS